jgi:glycosyltransferase involved in cell wall biosynthesis
MTARKHVLAVDASRMSLQRTGIENYVHHLLPHLCRSWSLLHPGEAEVKIFATDPAVAAHVSPAPEVIPGGGRGWTQLRLTPALRRARASVFFNPIPILPLVGALPCPAVVTVHDLDGFRPRWWYFQRLLRRSLARATRIVCDSQATREELVEEFPNVASKCLVVPLAANVEVFHPGPAGDVLVRLGIREPPLLAVGTVQPRKNYGRLIEAYSRLGAGAPPLVIVGKPGWEYEETMAMPASLGLADRVQFAGHLEEVEVGNLMRASLALCAVSTAEGFGIPVLEAMCCGLPVLASDIPPFREIAGTAARFVTPTSVDDIAAGLTLLLGDGEARKHMIEAGLARRSLFSWERAATDIVGALAEA